MDKDLRKAWAALVRDSPVVSAVMESLKTEADGRSMRIGDMDFISDTGRVQAIGEQALVRGMRHTLDYLMEQPDAD